jgi:hypothetical protein
MKIKDEKKIKKRLLILVKGLTKEANGMFALPEGF